MTFKEKVLGERALACRRFEFMDGMLILSLFPYGHALNWPMRKFRLTETESQTPSAQKDEQWIPDFSDPATRGCLLALVRRAWKNEIRSPEWWPAEGEEPAYWAIEIGGHTHCCESEAEALVVALERAP